MQMKVYLVRPAHGGLSDSSEQLRLKSVGKERISRYIPAHFLYLYDSQFSRIFL